MVVEWDEGKAETNLRKHGIKFADAVDVLGDEFAITLPDKHPTESRRITIGTSLAGRILVVVYVWRGGEFRLISARPATPRERRKYHENR